MRKTLFPLLLLVMFSITALADVRLPDNLKNSKSDKKAQMTIRINSSVKEPTLRIPRSAVNNLRAQLDELDGNSSTATMSGSLNTQTLMSGLFLSAALIFGGIRIFRGKSLGKNQKIAAGLLISAFLGASALTAFANVAPPAYTGFKADMFSEKMRGNWRGAISTVKIEVYESESSGAPIELIIPRDEQSAVKGEE